jgi:hypothetical protein
MIRRPAGPVLLWHSRAAWGEDRAAALLAATTEALMLWDGEVDYGELPDDIAVEVRLACTSPTRSFVAALRHRSAAANPVPAAQVPLWRGEPVVPGDLGHFVGPRGHVAAGGSGVVILVQEHPRQLIASAATTLAYRSSRRRSSTTRSGSRPGSRIPSCSASPAICAAVPVSEFVLGPESGTRLAVSALLPSPFVPVHRREAKWLRQ